MPIRTRMSNCPNTPRLPLGPDGKHDRAQDIGDALLRLRPLFAPDPQAKASARERLLAYAAAMS